MAAETGGASASEPIIMVTPEALEQLRELRDDEVDGDKLGLRLAIASDPGQEFRYDLSFEEYLTAAFTDEVRTHDGMKVIIPGDDVALLTGATLDYTTTQGLVIRNPNRPLAPSVEGLTADAEAAKTAATEEAASRRSRAIGMRGMLRCGNWSGLCALRMRARGGGRTRAVETPQVRS